VNLHFNRILYSCNECTCIPFIFVKTDFDLQLYIKCFETNIYMYILAIGTLPLLNKGIKNTNVLCSLFFHTRNQPFFASNGLRQTPREVGEKSAKIGNRKLLKHSNASR